MSQPTRGDIHVNVPLTNLSVAYLQKQDVYVAGQVFPVVPVQKQSDRYYKFLKEDFFRDEAQERAPGAESAGGGYEVDNTPTYFCKNVAFHHDVADQLRSNQDAVVNLDRSATEIVTQKLLIRREKQWMSSYFKTGVWANDVEAGGVADANGYESPAKWSQSDTADPVADIDNWTNLILQSTGKMPNTLVITRDVFTALKSCKQILDRIKYTQRGMITKELLASIFEIDRLFIIAGIENTAAKKKTATMQFFATNGAFLCYAAPSPQLMEASAGYTFAWVGNYGAEAAGVRIKQFRMEELASDRVEGEAGYDLKVVAADCGVFIDSVLT